MKHIICCFPNNNNVWKDKNGNPTICVYVEQWNDVHNDFDRLEFYLPDGQITEFVGFDNKTCDEHYNNLTKLKDVMFRYAEEHDPIYA